MIDLGETDTLTDLKEEFFNKYEPTFENSEFQRLGFYWGKLILLSQNKEEDYQAMFL